MDYGSPFHAKAASQTQPQPAAAEQVPQTPQPELLHAGDAHATSQQYATHPSFFLPTTPDGQYSQWNTLSGKLPTPHKPEVNLTTSTPNVKTPACTAPFNNCPCPQSIAWQYTFQNCAPKFFPLPQNCEIRPYPPNYRVYDLNELIFERSRTIGSSWNPYHFYNNKMAMYQFLASDLRLNNDPNLKPMNLNAPVTQYCFGCQARKPGEQPIAPPRYLSF